MALIYHRPQQVILDSSGNPVAGALLNVYLTATTTPTDSYTDAALTTPHANPVVADAGGKLPVVYFDPAVTYKTVLTTSAGVVIDTDDPAVDIFETTGTYTGTLTGCTTSPTGTVRWVKYGQNVTVFLPDSVSATSNTTAMSLTGAPATIRPTRSQWCSIPALTNNTAIATNVGAVMETSGTITFTLAGSVTGFTNSGTKGTTTVAGVSFTYSLV